MGAAHHRQSVVWMQEPPTVSLLGPCHSEAPQEESNAYPYTPTPTDNGVTGYSIIQADTLDEALNLLEGHPHLGWHEDCRIDVQELLEM